MENTLWTRSNARLKLMHTCISDKIYNWLFVPGGPGLGSESLTGLTNILNLPGNVWHFDFPGDGSNISENENNNNFSNWQKALIESTRQFDNVILVAHSSGGMFALATPDIEENLIGLVLMNSAPNSDWQTSFAKYVNENTITEAAALQKAYQKNPSNNLLKQLTISCAPYFSTKKGQEKIVNMLEKLPFNYKSHLWAEKNFDDTYKAKWIPKKIPTLIFAGNHDHLTPLQLFSKLNEFQRKNISIREINNAAHFPWIDNPGDVKQIFSDYCHWLKVTQ